jgi:hypothetical protein
VLERLEPVGQHPLRLVLLRADHAHDLFVEPLAALEDVVLFVAEAVLVLVEPERGYILIVRHGASVKPRLQVTGDRLQPARPAGPGGSVAGCNL